MADDVRSHPIEVNRTNAGVEQGSTDLTGATDKPRQPPGAEYAVNGEHVCNGDPWACWYWCPVVSREAVDG